MNIGPYTFEEFKERAAAFHGYPAPGLLLGGYMVAKAQRALPEGVLFEAIVETTKCLPDAVQLLTLCSTGNNWMKVLNLGKYAVSLFDKYNGNGFRVHLDMEKLRIWPEIAGWFLKLKPKAEQDTERLFQEIKSAGDSVCAIAPVRVRSRFLGHAHMRGIALCPLCHEAYPREDGAICRGCQGEAPYSAFAGVDPAPGEPLIIPVEESAGKKALHDMTRIIPGQSKGAAFNAGQTLSAGDVCRLQQMGRFHVAVESPDDGGLGVHENEGAEAFARRMAGEHVEFSLPPREGKINLRAGTDGLLCVDTKRLEHFNMIPDVMAASRQDGSVLEAGSEFAGTRVIPLYLSRENFSTALGVLDAPIFSIAPLRKAKAGILVTGTEVFTGLIEDKFIPIIEAKLRSYGCQIVRTQIVPDDKARIAKALEVMRRSGADLLVTTGGLSVDPEDVTRAALMEAGLCDVLYGAPVLPGAMSLIGRLPAPDGPASTSPPVQGQAREIRQPGNGEMQVIGVPACALYFKITLFDVLLPRLLAGRRMLRSDLAVLGEGGFCLNCKRCTWPKCFFVK